MQNKYKLFYRIITGLFSLMILITVYNFTFNYGITESSFESLGMPSILIYPLAVAKLLGLIAIWSRYSKLLKEWAYAGFFFDFILALMLHVNINDGRWYMAVIALVLMITSYWLDYEAYTENK